MVPPDLSQQNQMILFIILTLAYLVKGCKILPAHYEVHGDGLKNVIACRYILHSFRYQTKKRNQLLLMGSDAKYWLIFQGMTLLLELVVKS